MSCTKAEKVIENAKEVSKELEAMTARQAEAGRMAETKEDNQLGVHQCEICYTRGVGENDLNLICDECCDDLPSLLKSQGALQPLRDLFQRYQDDVVSIETEEGFGINHREWLDEFIEVAEKLLE